uniref:phospholipase A2 n=1 Tax=Trichuris muris TaxID=70415 RepID=A0A5S6Q2I8_TRIMR
MSESDGNPYGSKHLSKLLRAMIKVARDRIIGRRYWIPKTNDTVVEVPDPTHDSVQIVLEFMPFVIFRTPSGSDVTKLWHHIGLKCTGTLLSLSRWPSEEEALEQLGRLRPFSDLFIYLVEQTPKAFQCQAISRLIDAIKTHSLWSPVHIAAKIGAKGYFEKLLEDQAEAKYVLHSMCQPEGRYPLHIAVENGQKDIAKLMIEKLKVSSSQVDRLGQNALHYAARTSADMIGVLTANGRCASCINALSKDGYTPLFTAVTSARPSCAAALIKQGATLNVSCHGRSAVHEAMLQNSPRVSGLIRTLHAASPESFDIAEPETGNSALHVAGNKQAILALLSCYPQFNLEARNLNGQTALHLHVYNSNLPCVVGLICKNAQIDAQDGDGNTSLHIAVSNQDEPMTKLLLLFGANPNILNNNNKTPRHLAAKLSERSQEFINWLVLCGAKTCNNLNVYSQTDSPHHRLCLDNFSPSLQTRSEDHAEKLLDSFKQRQSIELVQRKINAGKRMNVVLTLDGGGVRGVVIIQILLSLEHRLKIPLNCIVDWLGGTSTGAIVGSAFAMGQSLRNLQKLYMLLKDEIFEGRTRPYPASRLEENLKSIVGPTTTMADITLSKLIITSVMIKNHPLRLHIFRNYQLPGNHLLNELYGFENPKDFL